MLFLSIVVSAAFLLYAYSNSDRVMFLPPMVIIIGSAVWAKALPAVSDIATNSVLIFILLTRIISVEFALYLNR